MRFTRNIISVQAYLKDFDEYFVQQGKPICGHIDILLVRGLYRANYNKDGIVCMLGFEFCLQVNLDFL